MQVVLDDVTVSVLGELARASGKSLAEVVGDSIAFYGWARREVDRGNSVAVIDHKAKRVTEIILPFRSPPSPTNKEHS